MPPVVKNPAIQLALALGLAAGGGVISCTSDVGSDVGPTPAITDDAVADRTAFPELERPLASLTGACTFDLLKSVLKINLPANTTALVQVHAATGEVMVNGGSCLAAAARMPLSSRLKGIDARGPVGSGETVVLDLSTGTWPAGKTSAAAYVATLGGDSADTLKVRLGSRADTVALTTLNNLTSIGFKLRSRDVDTDARQLVVHLGGGDDKFLADTSALPLVVLGGDGNDTITTGAGADQVFGGGGADILSTGAGADQVSGGEGADQILAGEGNDAVSGGGGNDTVFGGEGLDGNDALDGGEGVDTLDYSRRAGRIEAELGLPLDTAQPVDEQGNPVDAGYVRIAAGGCTSSCVFDETDRLLTVTFENLNCGPDSSRVFGNGLDNRIDGGGGNDIIYGGSGADTLVGGEGDDKLYGEYLPEFFVAAAGSTPPPPMPGCHDTLLGGLGADELHGQWGDDTLDGGDNNDREWGEDGDDTFAQGGATNGDDTLHGGDGFDLVSYALRLQQVQGALPDGSATTGNGTFNEAAATLPVEQDRFEVGLEGIVGGAGRDQLNGSDADNLLVGGRGSDQIFGKGGNDTIEGGSGTDNMQGGDGDDLFLEGTGKDAADLFDGGPGVDTVSYAGRTGALVVNLNGTDDDGEIKEKDNVRITVERVVGGDGPDVLIGSVRDEILEGGPGDDTLLGGAGVDILRGGPGDDTLDGDLGDDRLECGPGDDMVLSDASQARSADLVLECEY